VRDFFVTVHGFFTHHEETRRILFLAENAEKEMFLATEYAEKHGRILFLSKNAEKEMFFSHGIHGETRKNSKTKKNPF